MSYSKFNNLNRLSLRKNCFALLQTIFTLSCLISLITCQNTEAEDLGQSKIVLGMGTGTLTVLICIIIGIIICIFGLAFSSPGIFVFIGVALPLLVFIICISLPTGDDEEEDESENTHVDYYMVERWLYFCVMVVFFILLLLPVLKMWNITVIPQRVNSNTMRDTYDDKYLEDLEKQKKRKYNLENENLDDDEKLPLSSNKKKKNTFIRLDKDNENNVNKNLLENNLDEDNPLPMARVKRKDEFNENRNKFKKFKRIQNSQ